MKKVIIIVVSILALACLASCKKGDTACVCTATAGGVTVTSDYTPKDGEKCSDAVVNIAGVKYSCEAK